MHPSEARRVLRLAAANPTPAEIRAAFRREIRAVHPDAGGSDDRELANRIVKARDVLLRLTDQPVLRGAALESGLDFLPPAQTPSATTLAREAEYFAEVEAQLARRRRAHRAPKPRFLVGSVISATALAVALSALAAHEARWMPVVVIAVSLCPGVLLASREPYLRGIGGIFMIFAWVCAVWSGVHGTPAIGVVAAFAGPVSAAIAGLTAGAGLRASRALT
jgi:hypothetical protein